jgi:ABC-type lipoprotein release transport system permease subunit
LINQRAEHYPARIRLARAFLIRLSKQEVVISDGLARVLGVGLGEEVALIAQGVDGSVANGLYRVGHNRQW